ncbi:MAG: heparan-alpha-glucosaminide N-acetyltransferase domain-containing protein [Flavobacteriaceae bacterium]
MKTNRLYFIDAVRAFAILMMLQGHFIDTLLAVDFRDTSNLAFQIWQYFRGITAPVFFTISGLIFTYLLMKANKNGTSNERIKKGIVRGLMLIGIGYALRVPIFRWFSGSFDTYFLVIDVLQCIGLSLILIVFFYKFVQQKVLVFSVLMFCLGGVIFITEPLYRTYTAENIPLFFANYLTKSNGSIFTIFPWFGYMAYGAFIATLFYSYINSPKFKSTIIFVFLTLGLLLVNGSTWMFQKIYLWTDIQLISDVANFNYLFIRLGNVLVIFGIFYVFERFLKQTLILKIGQKTLSIYVIHFIVLFGSFTGSGLNRIFGKNLNPTEVIVGALLFLSSVSFIAIYRTKANSFLYYKIRQLTQKISSLFISRSN